VFQIGHDDINAWKPNSSDQPAFKSLLFSAQLLDLIMGGFPLQP
jgi:hypothetical protein